MSDTERDKPCSSDAAVCKSPEEVDQEVERALEASFERSRVIFRALHEAGIGPEVETAVAFVICAVALLKQRRLSYAHLTEVVRVAWRRTELTDESADAKDKP